MMQICVTGWVYPKEFCEQLLQIHNSVPKRYDVFVVAKKPCPYPLPSEMVENIGLDWFSFDWFLKNRWDGESAVFFTHDDTQITTLDVFPKIAAIQADVAMIFKNKKEAKSDMYVHGRAWKASARMLRMILEDGGFWYDERNKGIMSETNPHGESGFHYNSAVWKFIEQLGRITEANPEIRSNVFCLPDYICGIRGKIGVEALLVEQAMFAARKAKRGAEQHT